MKIFFTNQQAKFCCDNDDEVKSVLRKLSRIESIAIQISGNMVSVIGKGIAETVLPHFNDEHLELDITINSNVNDLVIELSGMIETLKKCEDDNSFLIEQLNQMLYKVSCQDMDIGD